MRFIQVNKSSVASGIRCAHTTQLWNEDTTSSQVIVEIQHNLDKPTTTAFAVGAFVNVADICNSNNRQRGGRILFTDGLLKRVRPCHVAIACEQEHAARLHKAPYCTIVTVN